jgi:hypothetical protein
VNKGQRADGDGSGKEDRSEGVFFRSAGSQCGDGDVERIKSYLYEPLKKLSK